MRPIIVLILIALANLSGGQVAVWRTSARKRINGFPAIDLEVPAGRHVVVQFQRFNLDGPTESCGEDKVVMLIYGGGTENTKQSIDFCGDRRGEQYKIQNPSASDSIFIHAYAELPRRSRTRTFVIKFKLPGGAINEAIPDLPLTEEDPQPPPSTSAPTPGTPGTTPETPVTTPETPGSTPEAPSPPTGSFECGKPISDRIVGGNEATPFSIPWQVALVPSGGMRPFCGGTLISPRHVMTAAHCTRDSGVDTFEVVVGEHNVETDADGVAHTVACKAEHPEYNPDTSLNFDFAILTLNKPVDITSADSKARAACLASDPKRLYGNGESLTVSGWGLLDENDGFFDLPNVLHHVQVPGVSNQECRQDYGSTITPQMICAGLDEGGIDSCSGDSGGPLTFEENGTTDLVGVVSFGVGCALESHYGVYARITEVLPWIMEQGVQENEDRCPR